VVTDRVVVESQLRIRVKRRLNYMENEKFSACGNRQSCSRVTNWQVPSPESEYYNSGNRSIWIFLFLQPLATMIQTK
jgi:hypothetical protein